MQIVLLIIEFWSDNKIFCITVIDHPQVTVTGTRYTIQMSTGIVNVFGMYIYIYIQRLNCLLSIYSMFVYKQTHTHTSTHTSRETHTQVVRNIIMYFYIGYCGCEIDWNTIGELSVKRVSEEV